MGMGILVSLFLELCYLVPYHDARRFGVDRDERADDVMCEGMPASASADLIKALVPDGLCEVKIYEQAAHGLYLTHAGRVMRDLLEFVVSVSA
jgi:hypothetical protein